MLPGGRTEPEKDQNVPFNPAALSYNIPLDNANSNNIVSFYLKYFSNIYLSFLFEKIEN